MSKLIISSIMLIACMPTFADGYDDPDNPRTPLQGLKYRYALGFDVTEQIMHPAGEFVNITNNTREGLAIYASYRTRGPLGFELGYHFTTDKSKNFSTVPGTQLFGATATKTTSYQCKMRIEDTYIDAYWHHKIKKIAELKLGLGVGFVRENLVFYNPNGGFSDPVGSVLAAITTTTTTVARFNIGAQTMLTRHIGARALFGLQTTSDIKAVNAPQSVNPHMFCNSYMFSIGLFYTISGYYNDNPGPNGEFIN